MSAPSPAKPTIRWFVYAGGHGRLERLAHEASMVGSWLGWDVECSCGWGSRTGGAIKARVEEARAEHLYFEHGVRTGVWRNMPDPCAEPVSWGICLQAKGHGGKHGLAPDR